MSALRETSIALARADRHGVLSVERLFATERVAAGLEARRTGKLEPWSDLVDRARAEGVATLTVAQLRRLIGNLWTERALVALAEPTLECAVAVDRRSVDRAIVEAYLRDYPVDHRAFGALREAAALVAGRRDWRWRSAGETWRLWKGLEAFRRALLDASDPEALLREAGFVGRLADGAFVRAARIDAARPAR